MAITQKERETRKERGLRARRIREELLRLSRPDIQRKYGIPTQTQQGWEDAKYGGINESAAQKLIELYQAEGLNISVEYLMYGDGNNPFNQTHWTSYFSSKIIQLSEEEIVAQELKTFHKLNTDATHFIIKDDGLAPWLMPGDYVAGKWHFDNEIEKTIGCPCIIQTHAGETLVRIVRSGSNLNLYDLICSNINTSHLPQIRKDIKILSAAPIIWIRKTKIVPNF